MVFESANRTFCGNAPVRSSGCELKIHPFVQHVLLESTIVANTPMCWAWTDEMASLSVVTVTSLRITVIAVDKSLSEIASRKNLIATQGSSLASDC